MEGKRIKILNVEDEEVDQMALMRMVREKGLNYDVDWAANLAQANEFLGKNRYDVVLLDYIMPDGTGLDVLKSIKGAASIFLTGSGDEMVAVKAMKGGVYDYIIKDPTGGYLELLPLSIEKAIHTFKLEEEKKRSEAELKTRLEEERRLNKLLIEREFRIKELRDENERLKTEIQDLKLKIQDLGK